MTPPSIDRPHLEAEIVQMVAMWRGRHGYGPSFRDLASHLGLPLGTVHDICRHLRDDGRLVFSDRRARTMDVV